MKPFVFLGGTVGESSWRQSVTLLLIQAGVPAERIFDPVVSEWTDQSQALEDEAKRQADYLLFYLCDVSGYSLVEATMGLYDRMVSTVVVFDLAGLEGHALKSLVKCEHDLRARFPTGLIFSTAGEAVAAIAGVRVKTSTGGLS